MQKANSEIFLNELTDLASTHLKNRFWQKGPKVRAELKKNVEKFFLRAKKLGWWDVLYDENGKMAAYVAGWEELHLFWVYKTRVVEIYRNRNSQKSLLWIEKKLRKKKSFFNSRTELHVPSADLKLCRVLLKLGFSIDSVILIGDVNQGYRQLMKAKKPKRDLKEFGYTLNYLKTKKEALQAWQLENREFSRNPQFGWFLALPEVKKKRRKLILASIGKGNAMVIKDSKENVKGLINFPVYKSDRLGSCGGVGLVMSKDLQGRGLAKVLYRNMLEVFRAKKVKYFKGGTSQPPVMKLGKLMGREKITYLFRYGKGYFSPSHFGFPLAK